MTRSFRIVSVALALSLGFAAVSAAQQVSLTIRDGRVTLKTENASIRQILDEWARVGQLKVVNAEKVTGPPQTLTLVDVPEREALDTLLRSAAGYAAIERDTAVANASVFDKILVMARTTPVTQAAANTASAPATYTPPTAEPADDQQNAQADNEPPQPTAPVVNPYANAPGAANANAANANAYGGGVGAGAAGAGAAGAGATVSVRPPETRFDYTNPQAYFEQQRRAQQAAQAQQGGAAPPQTFNPYPGSAASPIVTTGGAAQPTQPTGVPTAPTTTSQPGFAPQPATPPPGQGGGFNPYNMNPYNMPPNAGSTPSTTPVEPDRAKYANPYVPTKPPQP